MRTKTRIFTLGMAALLTVGTAVAAIAATQQQDRDRIHQVEEVVDEDTTPLYERDQVRDQDRLQTEDRDDCTFDRDRDRVRAEDCDGCTGDQDRVRTRERLREQDGDGASTQERVREQSRQRLHQPVTPDTGQ